MVKYKLELATWEITTACNMCCKHCGTISGHPRKDELTTSEAQNLCEQLGEMGVVHVTLSGGEPFLRQDWHSIAEGLIQNNIRTNIISNGWFIDEKIIRLGSEIGLSNIAISIDGCEESHDFIRVKGSFKRIMNALDLLKKSGMRYVVSTCINKRNLKELALLKDILIKKGVHRWQLQLGEATGNLLKHPELILCPSDIGEIIDFAYEVAREGAMSVDLVDNIGYYDVKSTEICGVSAKNKDSGIWGGCQAGKAVIGIRSNGDITPCLSIKDDSFIEGNIRSASLKEIWNRPGAFDWNRKMSRDQLTGFCNKCQYANLCLGGCASLKLTMCHSLYNNDFCIYKVEVEKEMERVKSIDNVQQLVLEAEKLIEEEQLNVAEIYLSRVLEINPDNKKATTLLKSLKKQ